MLNYFNNRLVIITLSRIGNPVNHLSELLHCSPSHTIGQQRQESVSRSIISKGFWSPGVYLSRSYWIFSACRIKNMPARDSRLVKIMRPREKTCVPIRVILRFPWPTCIEFILCFFSFFLLSMYVCLIIINHCMEDFLLDCLPFLGP